MAQSGRLRTPAAVLAGCLFLACGACGSPGIDESVPGNPPQAAASPAESAGTSPSTANRAPHILSQPQSVIARENDPIILSVTADGVPAPTYQWTKDGRAIAGATGAIYRVQSARATDAGAYQVAITNAAGSILSHTVGVAVEVVGVAPVITEPPVDLAVIENTPSSLKVVASGTPPLSYLWSREGRGGFLSTEAELWLANPQAGDSGVYVVEVSNRWGKATSTCRVTVNPRLREQ